jgi:serine O-acetyltransferase
MAQHQTKPVLDTVDPVWARVRREAEEIVKREPELASFIYSTILHHDTLEAAIIYSLYRRT